MNKFREDNLKVKIGGRMSVMPSEIIFLSADVNYTFLHLADGKKIIVSYNLGKLQERLSDHSFFLRANKGVLVNMNFVTKFCDNCLKINEMEIKISRRSKKMFIEYYKNTD